MAIEQNYVCSMVKSVNADQQKATKFAFSVIYNNYFSSGLFLFVIFYSFLKSMGVAPKHGIARRLETIESSYLIGNRY